MEIPPSQFPVALLVQQIIVMLIELISNLNFERADNFLFINEYVLSGFMYSLRHVHLHV